MTTVPARHADLFDITTVIFRGELELLELQAASLDRFFPAELVRRILVLLNDVDEEACGAAVERLRPAYGKLAPKVQIASPADLFALRPAELTRQQPRNWPAHWFTKYRHRWPWGRKGGWRGNRGWSVQQALKLAVGRAVQAPYVLILDAKNHLVRPVTVGSFVGPDGRPRSHLACRDRQQRRWIEASFIRMGMTPPAPDAPAPPSVTPVSVRTDVLRGAVDAIERRIGPVETFFARKRKFETEFMLLYAYVVGRYGDWSAAFEEGLVPPATIFRSTGDEAIRELLDRVERGEADFLAIHGSRMGKLEPDVQARLEAIWRRCELPLPGRSGARSSTGSEAAG